MSVTVSEEGGVDGCHRHDVFISFRGEDTRRNFTSHLHSALSKAGINAYIDDYLEKGDDVWPELSKAIDNSHAAIIVFSTNYATSKWCLEELARIIRCRKTQAQVVIPVFYQVDPSHIRNQTGSYGEPFAQHERLLREKNDDPAIQQKISDWKLALAEAANISGYDSRSPDHKNESLLIDTIVNDVLEKLDQRFPKELKVKGLVGIDKIRKDFESLLSKKKKLLLKNVQAVGIWGMGGIGKTTIAKAVFSQLFPLYDSVCFLANIREVSQNNQQSKLASLRHKLLSQLLKEQTPKSNLGGSTFIMRRLNSKKVFIVLDDVDSLDQLEVLCSECNGAARDSKLIITTRNRDLIDGRVDDIYDVKALSFHESLMLFSLHAFKEIRPQEGYEALSERAVEYAGGVPLALKVLGSNLFNRDTEFWESEMEKLKNYPYGRIQNVLRVSYDGLESLEKKIFLDIAFFFKDENKDFVRRILKACYSSATSGIKVLEDRALITISNSKRIQMHDLIQEMGLQIVRQDVEDPGKRTRLRDIEEVSHVLEHTRGSDAVEGIKLDLSQIGDLRLNADAFNMMINLRFLKLYMPPDKRSGNVVYPRFFKKFPDKLRYFEWYGYSLKSLPATFNAKMLVEIHMPHSHVTELWRDLKDVLNLEGIDLSDCKQLKNLPDLSTASKLKWVNLSGCVSLRDVHPSILSLDSLEILILDNCKKLKSLKSEKHLRSLWTISVKGCTSLKEFSVSSESMRRLDLCNAGIESIGHLSNLLQLNLEGLRLKNLPNDLSFPKNLEILRISDCRLLAIDKQKLHVLFDGLKSLKKLYLKDCCNLSELPDNIGSLSDLYKLILDGSSVEMLPASIKLLNNLEILSLKNCQKLRYLPELPRNIKDFNAINCKSLETVSTLKTFAVEMKGREKCISFLNCTKLDRPSLDSIMEGAQLTMMSSVFHNVFVRSFGVDAHSYNYDSVKVCLPGNTLPEQFTYRTTCSSITIKLPSGSNLLGILLCAVLSPSEGMKKLGSKICCQCYLANGSRVGYATSWHHKAIMELNSDHVYMWYSPFHFDSIISVYERQVRFEFYVTNNKKERGVFNIHTKDCGVRLIFDSELGSLLWGLDLDKGSKRKLGEDLASELGLDLGSEFWLELESQDTGKLRLGEEEELVSEASLELGLRLESQHAAALTVFEGSDDNKSSQELDLSEKISCSCQFQYIFSSFCCCFFPV